MYHSVHSTEVDAMAPEQVEIEIDAPVVAVWAALTDVQSWPDWTPTLTSVQRLDDGPLAVGSRTRVKQPRMAAIVWEVRTLDARREFTWVGRSPGVLTAGGHLLTAVGERTRLTLNITHTGPLAGLVARLTRARTRRYLIREAEGLKASAQARQRTT
jgi:uncharacterized membrane protein